MFIFVQILTASRIIGVIPLMWLVLAGYHAAAFFVFVALALTDIFDGWLARIYGCVSDWGKFFDPMADKIFLLVALFILLPKTFMQVEFPVLLAVEITLFGTSLLAYVFPEHIGRALGANKFGKYKVFGEVLLATALLGQPFGFRVASYVPVMLNLWFVIILAVFSYFGHLWPIVLSPQAKEPLPKKSNFQR